MYWANTACAQSQNSWSFATIPSDGVIYGLPDELIGWGYILRNESLTDWLLAYDVEASNTFKHAIANAAPFDYPALPPGTSISVPYSGTQGLYELIWDVDAPDGFANFGIFTMSSYWYDGDPFSGGRFVGDAGVREASYRAVTGAAATDIPEPGTLPLLAIGLIFSRWLRFPAPGHLRRLSRPSSWI